jgi:hypothetical protein
MMDDWDSFDQPPVASTSSGSAGTAKQHIVFSDDLNLVRTASDVSKVLKRKKQPPSATTASSGSASKKGKFKSKGTGKQAALAAEQEAQLEAEQEEEKKRVEEANVSPTR